LNLQHRFIIIPLQ